MEQITPGEAAGIPSFDNFAWPLCADFRDLGTCFLAPRIHPSILLSAFSTFLELADDEVLLAILCERTGRGLISRCALTTKRIYWEGDPRRDATAPVDPDRPTAQCEGSPPLRCEYLAYTDLPENIALTGLTTKVVNLGEGREIKVGSQVRALKALTAFLVEARARVRGEKPLEALSPVISEQFKRAWPAVVDSDAKARTRGGAAEIPVKDHGGAIPDRVATARGGLRDRLRRDGRSRSVAARSTQRRVVAMGSELRPRRGLPGAVLASPVLHVPPHRVVSSRNEHVVSTQCRPAGRAVLRPREFRGNLRALGSRRVAHQPCGPPDDRRSRGLRGDLRSHRPASRIPCRAVPRRAPLHSASDAFRDPCLCRLQRILRPDDPEDRHGGPPRRSGDRLRRGIVTRSRKARQLAAKTLARSSDRRALGGNVPPDQSRGFAFARGRLLADPIYYEYSWRSFEDAVNPSLVDLGRIDEEIHRMVEEINLHKLSAGKNAPKLDTLIGESNAAGQRIGALSFASDELGAITAKLVTVQRHQERVLTLLRRYLKDQDAAILHAPDGLQSSLDVLGKDFERYGELREAYFKSHGLTERMP